MSLLSSMGHVTLDLSSKLVTQITTWYAKLGMGRKSSNFSTSSNLTPLASACQLLSRLKKVRFWLFARALILLLRNDWKAVKYTSRRQRNIWMSSHLQAYARSLSRRKRSVRPSTKISQRNTLVQPPLWIKKRKWTRFLMSLSRNLTSSDQQLLKTSFRRMLARLFTILDKLEFKFGSLQETKLKLRWTLVWLANYLTMTWTPLSCSPLN